MQQRRRPVHRPWTDKNRIILCLLKRSYERKHIAPIWSHIFQNRLTFEGFTHGIPATTLDAQYQEMKGGGSGHEIHTHISDATQELVEREYRTYLDEIRQAIQRLGNGIMFRSSALAKSTRPQPRARRPALRRAVSIPLTVVSDATSNVEEAADRHLGLKKFAYQANPFTTSAAHAPPTLNEDRQHHARTSETPLPVALNIRTDANGTIVRPHPLLLFRATPTINHFRSRKFADRDANIPPPPVFGSKEFKAIVWPHLERDKSYLLPFISLAQNPRNALRRVETARSEESDKKMFLTIFAFNDLQADGKNRLGSDSGPYLVRSLFTAKEISDLPDGYKGSGEVSDYYLLFLQCLTSPVAGLWLNCLRTNCNS